MDSYYDDRHMMPLHPRSRKGWEPPLRGYSQGYHPGFPPLQQLCAAQHTPAATPDALSTASAQATDTGTGREMTKCDHYDVKSSAHLIARDLFCAHAISNDHADTVQTSVQLIKDFTSIKSDYYKPLVDAETDDSTPSFNNPMLQQLGRFPLVAYSSSSLQTSDSATTESSYKSDDEQHAISNERQAASSTVHDLHPKYVNEAIAISDERKAALIVHNLSGNASPFAARNTSVLATPSYL
mmetsp:Transcript_5671/g.9962  ORF Transcript_5671/g.9962 Transcript_5671/m.9962 type:complete len:240 (+) Transcript_5671:352-1071(+)